MRFAWNRATAEQTTDEPMTPATETAAAEHGLAGIDLQTVTGRRLGWIATEGQRTSDWLNAKTEVPVKGLMDGAASELPAEPPRGALSETVVARDDIVWVVPPPLPPNRHLRLHRRRILVHLELDEYEVSGQVHVRPGADAVDQVLRGTRDLVPLTEVQVVSRANPSIGFVVPVLVVNRIHVRRVVEDSPHTSQAVPEPAAPMPSAAELDPRIAWLVPDSPAPAEPDPVEEEPPPAQPSAETAAPDLIRTALDVLLAAGVIDVVEFQSIRARIPAAATD